MNSTPKNSENFEIIDPFNLLKVREYKKNSSSDFEHILGKVERCQKLFKKTPSEHREKLLLCVAKLIRKNKDELRRVIVEEIGKPIVLAEQEVERAASVFEISAKELRRLRPCAAPSVAKEYEFIKWQRESLGSVLAITPFNFPLNLVAHKVAPALAVGSCVIVKPPPQAPTASIILGDFIDAALKEISMKLPSSPYQQALIEPEELKPFLNDPRFSVLSFTGSSSAGWQLKKEAYQKKCLLELGGDATVILNHTLSPEKIDFDRLTFGAFAFAGQICISIQKIFIHHSIYETSKIKLIEAAQKVMAQDPKLPTTLMGPVIHADAADRIERLVLNAKKEGTTCLTPWIRNENCIQPLVMENVAHDNPLWTTEVFGPIVLLEPYSDEEKLIKVLNQSSFGIQGSIFTEDQESISFTLENWDMPTILINEIPTYRFDHLPYGGVKKSGIGKEGPAYAMEEFSQWTMQLKKKPKVAGETS